MHSFLMDDLVRCSVCGADGDHQQQAERKAAQERSSILHLKVPQPDPLKRQFAALTAPIWRYAIKFHIGKAIASPISEKRPRVWRYRSI